MSKQDKHGIQNTRVYMGKQNIAEYNRVFNSTRYTWLNRRFNNYPTSARMRDEMVVDNQARSDELAIIMSYPTSASTIIVLLKTPTKYREVVFTLFVRLTDKVSGISCHAVTVYASINDLTQLHRLF